MADQVSPPGLVSIPSPLRSRPAQRPGLRDSVSRTPLRTERTRSPRLDEVQRCEDRNSLNAVRIRSAGPQFDLGLSIRARSRLETIGRCDRREVSRGFAPCARDFPAAFSVDPNRIELSTS